MATQNYDIIVLGNDFAGLVAATLCASRGLRVLLAETEKHQDSYQLGSETLPVAPLFLSGIESPGIARVFDELHFQHLLKRRLEVFERGCQLLAPDLRLEADPDRERFARALRREIGTDEDWLLAGDEALAALPALLGIDACMPATGFWERRELGREIQKCHADAAAWMAREHGQAARTLARLSLLAQCGADQVGDLGQVRALVHTRQSTARFQGDWKNWRAIFLDKFKSHNGEVQRVDPQELSMSWGKVSGLRCVDDDFTCDYLIASMPSAALLELCGKKPPKRLIELAQSSQPVAFRYTLNLVMQLQGIPEGMASLAFSLLDPSAPATGGNFAIFSQRPAAQAGRVILSLQGLAETDEQGRVMLDKMDEGLLAHAREVMPFLSEHLRTWDSPHRAAAKDVSRSLSEPLAPEAIWSCPVDETLGIQAHSYATGLKLSCIASSQTLPELGLEGQFIAGWSAAKLASASMGKRKVSPRPTVLADAR